MWNKGVLGNHGCWVLLLAFCLLAFGPSFWTGNPALTHASDPGRLWEIKDAPPWEDILLWQVQDDDGLWACPWCGKKDNAAWSARCTGCGYQGVNPGGFLLCPVDAAVITNAYSAGHRGVDFGSREGTPVYAAADGVVVEARKDRWAGNIMRIQHENGLQTVYAHLREITVPKGCFVRMGEVVALSGKTGVSTGPHLHFEVLFQGEQVAPLPYLAP
jgi:murein DD-endopeptidase MepM/ murein hydrolase activator NlpD